MAGSISCSMSVRTFAKVQRRIPHRLDRGKTYLHNLLSIEPLVTDWRNTEFDNVGQIAKTT